MIKMMMLDISFDSCLGLYVFLICFTVKLSSIQVIIDIGDEDDSFRFSSVVIMHIVHIMQVFEHTDMFYISRFYYLL